MFNVCIKFLEINRTLYHNSGEFYQFSGENDLVYNMKISPASNHIENILFNEFFISENVLNVNYCNSFFALDITDNVIIEIRKINHLDVFPESLNAASTLASIVNIFHNTNESYEFIGTASIFLLNFNLKIKNYLEEKGLGTVDIEVAHFVGQDNVIFEPLSHFDVMRSDPERVMTVYVKSTPAIALRIGGNVHYVREMAQTPRNLLLWALDYLSAFDDPIVRRFGAICSNSGVPVNLIDEIPNFGQSSEGLQRFGLPLNTWSDFLDFFSTGNYPGKMAIDNLLDATSNNSSEATLRSLVLDQLLTAMLLEPTRNPSGRCFEMHSEWNAGEQLSYEYGHRVDLVFIVKGLDIPVLFVEIGKERPPSNAFHKDFTKMLCMMSQACFRLCRKVRSLNSDPRAIRVYGLWMGHSQIQFCVAHPIFVRNSAFRRTDIQVQLTFPIHWRFDLFISDQGTTHLDCGLDCCTSNGIIDGLVSLDLPINPLARDTRTFELGNFEAGEGEIELVLRNVPIVETVTYFQRNGVDTKSLCKLKVFSECVIETMENIATNLNVPSLFDNDFPDPFGDPQSSRIPSPRGSSTRATPKKTRFSPVMTTESANMRTFGSALGSNFTISKDAGFEVKFYEMLRSEKNHLISNIFPFLIDSFPDSEDEKQHIFVFEEMEPFLKDGVIQILAPGASAREKLIEAVTFAVNCLFGLLILHEKLGVVHSDISPNNVMFSPLGEMWKLNDFNDSLPIEESLKTPRKAGTVDFTAPESLESGIFTTASDVYSLGAVFIRTWYFSLCFNLELDDDLPQEVEVGIKKFWTISSKMLKPDPKERSTVREALKSAYDLVLGLKSQLNFPLRLYGTSNVFTLIDDVLANEPPRLTSSTSSTDVPMSSIES